MQDALFIEGPEIKTLQDVAASLVRFNTNMTTQKTVRLAYTSTKATATNLFSTLIYDVFTNNLDSDPIFQSPITCLLFSIANTYSTSRAGLLGIQDEVLCLYAVYVMENSASLDDAVLTAASCFLTQMLVRNKIQRTHLKRFLFILEQRIQVWNKLYAKSKAILAIGTPQTINHL
jgi:hypothetical protein